MQVDVATGAIQEQEAQAIVINLFEGVTKPSGATGAVDHALGGQISALIQAGDFRGKRDEVAVLYPNGTIPAQRVIVVGLGKREDFDLDAVRRAAATAARKARDLGVTHIHTVVHGAGAGGITPTDAAQAVVEGTILGLYRYRELKTNEEDVRPDVEHLTLVEFDPARREQFDKAAQIGQIVAEAACLTRDLVNRPANHLTPTILAQEARRIAEETGLRYEVLDEAQMEELGMDAFLSVARGSAEPARLIILEHRPENASGNPIVLVGKGITFDSGGISIKPSQGMEAMKGDMAGAAAVIGTMQAVARLDLPVHVIGLAPATENMPGGRATKPGDVVRSLKGLTIEIISTDAEGRMILADTLTYAERFHPSAIVDLATLTGACVVALGHGAAGIMGDENLIEQLREAGERTGERVWPMPLFDTYAEQLKSNVADVKNTGGRPAGAITAACFLRKFVPEGVPWAHIDIAGVAWSDQDRPYTPKWATGFGVRLLVDWLQRREGVTP